MEMPEEIAKLLYTHIYDWVILLKLDALIEIMHLLEINRTLVLTI